jgi:nitronate monooxygenase
VILVRTPVCELLGIKQPIVQAPMSAAAQPAAAVSNAGALGMLALTWSTPAGDVVRDTAPLTDRPFGGNLILSSDQYRRLDETLEAGMRIVSLMWGDPTDYVEQVHDANGVVLHTVGSAEEAWRAAASGVDVVVPQGWEAGGHVWGQVATLPLVPAVVDAVGTDASDRGRRDRGHSRGGRRARAGRSSGMAGYRILLAQEMPIHEEYRRRLKDAPETDAQ